ncbi:MAG: cytochrome C oxidase subunit IV family protein [Bdellovibrionaceae bacterium]|nr:cytochrome C oxidase subunit IV family protein [Pseudobdellovibrionaceae bacterium]
MSAHGNHERHITPFKTYLNVAIALFALTFLTMIAFWNNHHLGVLAGPVAFLIAAVKAVLVMGYFMHLKYEGMMNRVIFGTGFFFLLVLIFFSGLDIWTRISVSSTL